MRGGRFAAASSAFALVECALAFLYASVISSLGTTTLGGEGYGSQAGKARICVLGDGACCRRARHDGARERSRERRAGCGKRPAEGSWAEELCREAPARAERAAWA